MQDFTLQFVFRLTVALLCGSLGGFERQLHQGMAGTRTNALVSVGTAAFVMSGLLVDHEPTAAGRIASCIVTGIGFLGAGAIFKEGVNVKGLNTAATVWCSAAIGILAGFGSPHLSILLAIAVIFINWGLRPLSHKIHPMQPPVDTLYEIHLTCGEFNEEHLRSLLLTTISQSTARLRGMHSVDNPAEGQVQLSAELATEGVQNHEVERIALRLSIEPGISALSWTLAPKPAQQSASPAPESLLAARQEPAS